MINVIVLIFLYLCLNFFINFIKMKIDNYNLFQFFDKNITRFYYND